MTELRKRMIETLQLGGLSERTREAYVRAGASIARHYHKSPDLITEVLHGPRMRPQHVRVLRPSPRTARRRPD